MGREGPRGSRRPDRYFQPRPSQDTGVISTSSDRGEPVLELTNATVVKGGVTILHGLNLTIHDGEHTAIVGPNGAGKSTLVKLLTHHDYAWAADDGQPSPVTVYGRERWDVMELRAQLGVISADMHQRFVAGNSAGNLRAEEVVL